MVCINDLFIGLAKILWIEEMGQHSSQAKRMGTKKREKLERKQQLKEEREVRTIPRSACLAWCSNVVLVARSAARRSTYAR